MTEVVSRRRFFKNTAIAAAGVGAGALLEEGCNPSTWIQNVLNDMPTVLQVITSIISIIGSLSGRADASAVAIAQKAVTDCQTALQEAQSFITQFEANKQPTLLGQIDNALTTAQAQLGSILAALHITDPTYQAILSAAIGSALTIIVGIQSLIPPPPTPTAQRAAMNVAATNNATTIIKVGYNEAVTAAGGMQFRIQ